MFDNLMIARVKTNPHLSISWLLMASYLYYHRPEASPILSDERYDQLCKKVHSAYDKLKHRHKKLIKRDALATGSLYYLKERDYPLMVRSAAMQLSEEA